MCSVYLGDFLDVNGCMKIIVLYVLLMVPWSLIASEEVPDDIVIIKENSFQLAEKNGENHFQFDVEVKEGFFAYKDKFELNINGFNILELKMDPIVTFFDKTFQKNKEGVRHTAHFTGTLKNSGSSLPQNLSINLVYQACTTDYCLFPAQAHINYTLTEKDKAVLDKFTAPTWFQKGLLFSILFTFLAGFLTSLTPCVYPMLPITLAVLGAQKSKTKLEGFQKSFVYVLGMSVTYASLGVVASTTGFMFGSLMANKYFLGGLSVLLFVAALSMFDVFEIQTPRFLQNKLSNHHKSSSYLALFITGLFSGLMVGPCVGPVLVGILAFVSQTGSVVTGFTLLFSFALGLGSLIIVLGTFRGMLEKIPRSGNWMMIVKKALGVLFLGLILYFLQPILKAKALMMVGLIIAGLFASVQLFFNREKLKNSILELSLFRAIVVFSILFAAFTGFLSNERFERFFGYTGSSFANTHWEVYSEEAMEIAKNKNQFVVLDFYAEWCAACRELKTLTFADPKVSQFTDRIRWLYFDSTEPSEKLTELKNKYKILGLPTILFFDNNGDLRQDLTLTGFENSDNFLMRLKKLTQKGQKNENAH